MPRYKSEVVFPAAQAFFRPCDPEGDIGCIAISPAGSLATSCFNSCWAMARNDFEAGHITHFAMQHSDVAPPIFWIDTLMEELERTGADIVSAVIPIKDGRGLSSTAVDDTGDQWRHRRITMKEAKRLPKTFFSEDVGGPLLLNTGLWVAKLGPWMNETFFQVREHMRRDVSKGGAWACAVVSEDWDFSLQCHKLGLKLAATTAIEVHHYGEHKWSSHGEYGFGWETDNQNAPTAVKAVTEGFQFPHDVPGWLSQEEGTFLYELAKGATVLEIGSFCGKSTVCLAQAAAWVHAVDPFDARGVDGMPRRDTRAEFHANVARYGCSGKVIDHVGPSREKVPHIAETFDVIFIDGAHDYDSVLEDFALAASVLKPNGCMVFHDYGNGTCNDEPKKAVDFLVGSGAAQLGGVIGSLAIVRPTVAGSLVEATA